MGFKKMTNREDLLDYSSLLQSETIFTLIQASEEGTWGSF